MYYLFELNIERAAQRDSSSIAAQLIVIDSNSIQLPEMFNRS